MNINSLIDDTKELSELYEKNMKHTSNLINDIQQHATNVKSQLKKIQKKIGGTQYNLCPICFENQRDHLLCCKHVFCSDCCDKAVRLRICFICRAHVSTKTKIYL